MNSSEVPKNVVIIDPKSGKRIEDPVKGIPFLKDNYPSPYRTWKDLTGNGSPWARYILPPEVWVERIEELRDEYVRDIASDIEVTRNFLKEPDSILYFYPSVTFGVLVPWEKCTIITSMGDHHVSLGTLVASIDPKKKQMLELANLSLFKVWGRDGAYQYISNLAGRLVEVHTLQGLKQQYLPQLENEYITKVFGSL